MEWEFIVLNNIRQAGNDFWDKIMPCISFLGTWGLLWVVLMILCLSVKKYRKLGRSLACNLTISVIVCNVLLKQIVQRIRPYNLNTTIQLIIPPERDYYSFPSGHTFFAFASATIVFYYNKKAGAALYVLAALIAFSRLYLYMHFPTDVLFGAAFGILTAILSYKTEQMFFAKTEKPVNALSD